MRIIYDAEPRQNISLNRNRALSHVSGDYVAMVDDDQYVSECWLLSLYNTSVAFQAEVVCGPVLPIFEKGASVLVRKSNTFGLPNVPEGFRGGFIYHTGNCFFRTGLLATMKTPFDVELAARGARTPDSSKSCESRATKWFGATLLCASSIFLQTGQICAGCSSATMASALLFSQPLEREEDSKPFTSGRISKRFICF
jgi:glycosyltransferase involved in cell wall biosynthesis